MKSIVSILLVALLGLCAPVLTSCTTAPSSRVVQVQTLKAVAATAKAAIDGAADSLAAGKMSVAHYQEVAAFYDTKFQPASKLATQAVQSDLAPASPELLVLAAQLATLIASYTSN